MSAKIYRQITDDNRNDRSGRLSILLRATILKFNFEKFFHLLLTFGCQLATQLHFSICPSHQYNCFMAYEIIKK